MLEMMLDRHMFYVLMGSAAAAGVVSKCVANVSLKRLVRGAGNMNKSNHPLMRLVRAKFEHACMVSEKVENVGVFVDKYLYEYRVLGVKLHSWRRMEKTAAGLCLVLGLWGALLQYSVSGMHDEVLKLGAAGAGLGILIYLFHLTTDENYRMEAAKNYMVDYLENVCLHRYEKAYQKELKVLATDTGAGDSGMTEDADGRMDMTDMDSKRAEMEGYRTAAEKKEDSSEPQHPQPGREVPTPAPVPDVTSPIRGMNIEKAGAELREASERYAESVSVPDDVIRIETAPVSKVTELSKKEKPVNKDALIRQILEEFMA